MATHGTRDTEPRAYDAVLVLSFGGPEGPDDVMPFLEQVTRGRGVPQERLQEVARHYHRFGGVSPINSQTRALVGALTAALDERGPSLPVYWGNRNWHPFVEDTVANMAHDGIERAIAFVTSGYSSYSACRQYREDIMRARSSVGAHAPVIDKIRHFYNHPGFIEPQAERAREALRGLDTTREDEVHLLFTAHSVPTAMAEASTYVQQLREGARLVAERVDPNIGWDLVYQSRSGPPHVPWTEPDVVEHLDVLATRGIRFLVVVPIGFVSDHLEIRFDLDVEAAERARDLGIALVRAGTVGTDPRFVEMIRELILERMGGGDERIALGELGASHDICAPDCCVFKGMRPAAVS